jgi:hypothetical protein
MVHFLICVLYYKSREEKKGYSMANFNPIVLDIYTLLRTEDSPLNPSQQALKLVLNLEFHPRSQSSTKIFSSDRRRDISFFLFTLAGNPELGDELRSKVYEFAVTLYESCVD